MVICEMLAFSGQSRSQLVTTAECFPQRLGARALCDTGDEEQSFVRHAVLRGVRDGVFERLAVVTEIVVFDFLIEVAEQRRVALCFYRSDGSSGDRPAFGRQSNRVHAEALIR